MNFAKSFKNTFFYRTPAVAASERFTEARSNAIFIMPGYFRPLF